MIRIIAFTVYVLSRPTLLTAMETNSLTFMTEHGIYNPFRWSTQTRHCRVDEPESFHKSVIAAQDLAKEIDYCRVDLESKGDDIYFSEITLSPKRGKLKITPSIWDAKLGSMWDLSVAKTGSIESVYSPS
jgi:hypothetical protein